MNKYCHMMVGVPGSGKSTWIKENIFNNSIVLSTDDKIEEIASQCDMTYNQVFEDNIKEVTDEFFDEIEYNVTKGNNIIIDRTNLTPKSRKRILNMITSDYKKIAVVVQCSDPFIHANRLASRKGKTIPNHIIESMKNTFIMPSLEEGFNDITIIDTAPQMEEI
jgi:predicted kinase